MNTDAIEQALDNVGLILPYLDNQDNARAQLAEIKEALRWRDVRVELPEKEDFYDVFSNDVYMGETFYQPDSPTAIWDDCHWRPLLPGPGENVEQKENS